MVFRKPQDNSPPIWKSFPSSCSSSPSIIEGPRSLQNTIDHLMTIQQDMRTSMHGAGGGYGILWGQIIQGHIVVIAGAETSYFEVSSFDVLWPRILRWTLLKQEGISVTQQKLVFVRFFKVWLMGEKETIQNVGLSCFSDIS